MGHLLENFPREGVSPNFKSQGGSDPLGPPTRHLIDYGQGCQDQQTIKISLNSNEDVYKNVTVNMVSGHM